MCNLKNHHNFIPHNYHPHQELDLYYPPEVPPCSLLMATPSLFPCLSNRDSFACFCTIYTWNNTECTILFWLCLSTLCFSYERVLTLLSHQEIEIKATRFHNIERGEDMEHGLSHTLLVKSQLVNHFGKLNDAIY